MQIDEHPVAGPVLRIASNGNDALIAPRGAHVVFWRHRGREMLWLSRMRLEGKPLRGGIPICWPWFGAHPTDPSAPAHGVARLAEWQVVDRSADGVTLRTAHGNLVAQLDVVLADGLTLNLTTHNAGPAPVTITAALHTYLAVDELDTVRVTGLDGAGYIDKVEEGARKIQRGDLIFDREVDRIYAADRATLLDGHRAIEVDGRGTSHSLVAWNPWIDKSARLGDMAPEDYRHMVCLETAWAGDDVRTLQPRTHASLITALKPLAAPR